MAVALETMHTQVVRLTGVIDRFGSYESVRVPSRHSKRYRQRGWIDRKTVRTVCVRNLRLAETRQDVTPDHWWLHLRQEWAELSLQPGDVVLFTTKIHRCQKGYQGDQVTSQNSEVRVEYGPSRNVRDVTLISRSPLVGRYQEAKAENASLTVALAQLKQEYQADQELWHQAHTENESLARQLEQLKQDYDADQETWQFIQAGLKSDCAQLRQDIAVEKQHNQALLTHVSQIEKQLKQTWPKKQTLGLVGVTAVVAFSGGIFLGNMSAAPNSSQNPSSFWNLERSGG